MTDSPEREDDLDEAAAEEDADEAEEAAIEAAEASETATTEPVVFHAKQDAAGARLDVYVTARFSRLSRTHVQRLIRDGKVLLNGRPAKPSYEINGDEEISVEVPPPPAHELVAEYLPLDILYEDEKMIVINKPSGIVVHPARGHWGGTLINAVLYHCHNLSNIAPGRPGIVHRLDRETTGVILFMKEDWSHRHVAHQFEFRRAHKEYLAIVEGEMEYDADIISRPIGRHPTESKKMAVRIEGGREATTEYQVMERFRGYTYVLCKPKTGRTHQIRVHLAAVGHPVAADNLYSKRGPVYLSDLMGEAEHASDETPVIARQALHAYRLNIEYPGKGERIEFTAPLPEDMTRFLEILRKYRKA
jgi:23S rRNA pseudouridine1911/1915/1917 synthase